MLYELKYTNDLGDSILFGSDAYKVIELEGFGEVQADIQKQKAPYQDGSTFVDSILAERYPSIVFAIRGENYKDLKNMRRYVGRVFNPKTSGVLSFSNEGETYWIRCQAEHVPSFPDSGTDAIGRMQTVTIDLMAPDPYWRSLTVTEEPMAAFVELFEFPSDHWEVGTDGDLFFEMGIEGHTRTFTNNGDADMPIKVTIRGPAVNPKLTNLTTGEFIRVRRTLAESDILILDTEDSSVYLNGEDAFPWIDLSSSFWKLAIGSNDVQYTADAGQENATLTIEWQERYNAI